MKREIDIEKAITDEIGGPGGSGNQTRKKIFDDSKRQSEHNVIDSMWDVADNPTVLAKNHLYAAS